jgi:uncharacterized protein (TIGR02118 family)
MIHQHILASPRPGLSEAEFQDYWRYVHALKFARKIPQIRKYKVNARIDIPGQPRELSFSGVAEIWLDNEETQAASMKTPEFLDGALHDEPNWAASWHTIGLDTDAHPIQGEDTSDSELPEYKIMLFHKKRRDMSLKDFREKYLGSYAESLIKTKIPNLSRILSCTSRERLYQNGGAPPFDAVTHLSANSRLDLKGMVSSPELQEFLDPLKGGISEWWGVVSIAVRSEWVVGPEMRPYPLI